MLLKECTVQKDTQMELYSVGLMTTLLQQHVYYKQQSGMVLMLHSTDVRISALQHKLYENQNKITCTFLKNEGAVEKKNHRNDIIENLLTNRPTKS